MRIFAANTATFAFAVLMSAYPAQAEIVVRVYKADQSMTVLVDGAPRHRFKVSTGLAGGPPLGTFRPQRMERTWHSRLFNMAPMPYSIFFHGHFAVHGTNQTSKLGRRASKGCVRLHPNNAAILFALVQKHGMARTRIVIDAGSAARAEMPAAEPVPDRKSAS